MVNPTHSLSVFCPAAQKRQSRRPDQRPVRGERPAAEGSGDHGAEAQDL